MYSIGNDIVDLSERNPPLHPRFAARAFTPAELRQIGNSWQNLWLHWAAKEAAFKAMKRLLPQIAFIPKQFEFDRIKSEVRGHNQLLDCKWIVSRHYVYVSCATKSLSRGVAGLKNWIEKVAGIPKPVVSQQMSPQSQFVRALARRKIALELSRPVTHVEIGAGVYSSHKRLYDEPVDLAIPRLYLCGKETDHLLSFTHHGRFAACAFDCFESEVN